MSDHQSSILQTSLSCCKMQGVNRVNNDVNNYFNSDSRKSYSDEYKQYQLFKAIKSVVVH